jgi:hypothetical protein
MWDISSGEVQIGQPMQQFVRDEVVSLQLADKFLAWGTAVHGENDSIRMGVRQRGKVSDSKE